MSINALSLAADIPLTMSSIELLEVVNQYRVEFGESSVRHNDFLARCRDELDDGDYETFVTAPPERGGRPMETIRMTADQCKLVAMRESKGVRRRVLARLNELEAQAKRPVIALPQTYIEALEHLLETKRSEQLAIAQRDEAVRTKAQIGSRREATAMATAAAAKREASRLREQLGFNTRHATVIAVEKALKCRFGKQDWRQLKAWCVRNEVLSTKVHDPRWGEAVAWPAGAWLDVFGVNLAELFGEVAQ